MGKQLKDGKSMVGMMRVPDFYRQVLVNICMEADLTLLPELHDGSRCDGF